MSSLLHDMNFEKTDSDQCLFIKRGSNPILIATYVDDLLVASPTIDGIIKFENDLQKKINLKVLGDVKHILGWNINYDDKLGVSITQRSYITRILKQFGMQDCNPVKTPALKCQQVKTDTNEKEQEFPYREAVGGLLYVANSCRPDIAQATHHAARFVNDPTKEHVQAVKRIFRYLKGTVNTGIIFKKCNTYQLQGYADADYAGDTASARSTTGYIFVTNGPISWRSRRQQITALSTTEAELNAFAAASKEAVWLTTILIEINLLPTDYLVKIFEDNTGCLALVQGKRTPARTRHMAVRIGYVRDLIMSKIIDVICCPTKRDDSGPPNKAIRTH